MITIKLNRQLQSKYVVICTYPDNTVQNFPMIELLQAEWFIEERSKIYGRLFS